MELKIKVVLNEIKEIQEVIQLVKDKEKEYSCNCTLLEIEINPVPLVYQGKK